MEPLSCPVAAGDDCKFLSFDPMRFDEVDQSVELIRATFPHMDIPAYFWKRKLEEDATFLLKKNGDTIVGIMNVSERGSSIGSVDLLAIVPGMQGKGLGSVLLQTTENELRAKGKHVIRLMTEQVKPENVAFYSKHGYKVTGFDPKGYRHSPSVNLAKDL